MPCQIEYSKRRKELRRKARDRYWSDPQRYREEKRGYKRKPGQKPNDDVTYRHRQKDKKRNAETINARTVKGIWSKSEIDSLVLMRSEGMTAYQIAVVLGRSMASVRGKFWIIDNPVPRMNNRCRLWCESDDETLKIMYYQGATFSAMAAYFGRTEDSIRVHMSVMRKRGDELPVRNRVSVRSHSSSATSNFGV